MKIITQVTTQVSIPKHWLSGDWDEDIILKVKSDVWNFEGKHTPVIREITCTGYQMWIVNSLNYFDVVYMLDKHILDVYANMKLNEADDNLMDYAE
jgi:hypothetical protein